MKSFSAKCCSAALKLCRVNRSKIIHTLTISALGLSLQVFAGPEKISSDLARYLEQGDGTAPVLVLLQGGAYIPQTLAQGMTINEREQAIKQRMLQLQSSLRDFVKEQTASSFAGSSSIRRHKFFWNTNALMATTTADMINELSDREDVRAIILDRKITLGRDYRTQEEPSGDPYTYGLDKIGVPELREKHPGLTGKGVIVGIIDTGLDAAHPEFKGRKVTFKDFVGNKKEAYDDNGHGTHVAGTIGGLGVSGTQIGIAPEVEFAIAKVFSAQGGADTSTLLRAMEWMADPQGTNNGQGRPRVVNNSWGGSMGGDAGKDPFYQAVITWVQLEIFPSFAAGNSGPSRSSVGTPGGLPPAFAIGATDSADKVAYFSSRGPVNTTLNGKPMNYIKPDVSAPGVKVMSSMPGGGYGAMSGTSMATPHTTGAIALLYQAKPDLKVSQIRDLLSKTSQDLGGEGMDNEYGAGRIHIARAVEVLANQFQLNTDEN